MKVLRFLARLLALVLSLLFVLTALVSLLLLNIDRRLLQPPLWKRVLQQERVYERLPALAAATIASQSQAALESAGTEEEGSPASAEGEGGPPPFVQNLTEADYEAIIRELAPPDWIQEQFDSVLDQLFLALARGGSGAGPDVVIATASLKRRLAEGGGLNVARRLLAAQPACSQETLAGFSCQGFIDGGDLCRLPDPLFESCRQDFQAVFEQAAAGIPDELALNQLGGSGEEEGAAAPPGEAEGLAGLEQFLRTFRLVARLGWLLPLLLLLLITLLAVRSWRSWLHWWGACWLALGVLAGLLALAVVPLYDALLAGRAQLPAGMPPMMLQFGLDTARAVLRAFLAGIGLQAALIVLAGLVMLLSSPFVPARRQS